MFRLHRKVERLLFLNPANAKGQRTAFGLRPRRSLRACGSRGQGCARIIHASKQLLDGIVHFASFMQVAIGPSTIPTRRTVTQSPPTSNSRSKGFCIRHSTPGVGLVCLKDLCRINHLVVGVEMLTNRGWGGCTLAAVVRSPSLANPSDTGLPIWRKRLTASHEADDFQRRSGSNRDLAPALALGHVAIEFHGDQGGFDIKQLQKGGNRRPGRLRAMPASVVPFTMALPSLNIVIS